MKINFDRFGEELLSAGMQKVRVKEMVKQLRQDMIDWPEVYNNWETCKWALERGFLPGRVELFGKEFNEQTYCNYYNDFEYFMAHPLNNHFAIWINDKLTLKYMLGAPEMAKYMPEYYLYIENDGHYSYLMDVPESINRDSDFIYNLLIEKKHLALKPNRGAGGAGFVSLKYENNQIYMNGNVISRGQLEDLKPKLNGYIVTEFIKQTKELDKVYPGTDCALRIILYKKLQKKPEDAAEYGCLISHARFGTSISKGASNLSAGGVVITVDWETGKFEGKFRGYFKYWGKEGVFGFSTHPDTGVGIDGEKIPHWNKVKNGLLKICNYLSSLDYFGMDVIITEDGFKLCEVNSAPSIGLGQFAYGKCCMDNEDARRFVESKRRPHKKNLIECFEASVEE